MQKSQSTPSGDEGMGESVPVVRLMKVYLAGVNVFRLTSLARLLQYKHITGVSPVTLVDREEYRQMIFGIFNRSALAAPDWLKHTQPTQLFQYITLGIRLERWLLQMTGLTLIEIDQQRPSIR